MNAEPSLWRFLSTPSMCCGELTVSSSVDLTDLQEFPGIREGFFTFASSVLVCWCFSCCWLVSLLVWFGCFVFVCVCDSGFVFVSVRHRCSMLLPVQSQTMASSLRAGMLS